MSYMLGVAGLGLAVLFWLAVRYRDQAASMLSLSKKREHERARHFNKQADDASVAKPRKAAAGPKRSFGSR